MHCVFLWRNWEAHVTIYLDNQTKLQEGGDVSDPSQFFEEKLELSRASVEIPFWTTSLNITYPWKRNKITDNFSFLCDRHLNIFLKASFFESTKVYLTSFEDLLLILLLEIVPIRASYFPSANFLALYCTPLTPF